MADPVRMHLNGNGQLVVQHGCGELVSWTDYEKLRARIAQLDHEKELTWSIFELLGVPKDRGKSLDNALMVFDQRLRNELSALSAENQRLRVAVVSIGDMMPATQECTDLHAACQIAIDAARGVKCQAN